MPAQVWPRAGFPAPDAYSRPIIIVVLCFFTVLRASSAVAEDKVDSEHLFGFTEGSDIGSNGEREFKSETTLRTGKVAGDFAAIASEVELKYTIWDDFRLS